MTKPGGHRKKSLYNIVCQTTGESLQRMQNRWRSQNLVAFPLFVGLTRADPFAICQFCVAGHARLLFCGTVCKKEPGIKSSRRERGRHPTADKNEIVRVQMQPVMLKQLRP